MNFYKKYDDNGNIVLIASTVALTDSCLMKISAAEYSQLCNE